MTKNKEKLFNNKPIGHWLKMSEEIVVDVLVRAAINLNHPNHLPGSLAAERLMNIAVSINPGVVKVILAERDRSMKNIVSIMKSFLPTPSRKSHKQRK